MIEPEHIDEARQYPNLGPAYFAAQAIAERFMTSFQEEQFKPLIDKFAAEFNDRLWSDLQSSLLGDTQSNLRSDMWRMVDQCVTAVLSGERWVMEKYALGSRYDCDKVRETVAKHIPAELQDKRVTDLEEEVKRLREDNEFLQRMR
jgi:hypothetical protein